MRHASFRISRDVVLFVSGLSGMIHETVIAAEPRLVLIPAFLGMMGATAVLRLDEKRKDDAQS